jgi:hypothetical protein
MFVSRILELRVLQCNCITDTRQTWYQEYLAGLEGVGLFGGRTSLAGMPNLR